MRNLNEAVSLLWNRANDRLSLEELDNLKGSTEYALMMSQHLATTLGNLGALVFDDESVGSLRDPEDVSALLFGLQNQVEMIHSLAWLGSEVEGKIDNLLGWTVDARLAAKQRLVKKGGVKA